MSRRLIMTKRYELETLRGTTANRAELWIIDAGRPFWQIRIFRTDDKDALPVVHSGQKSYIEKIWKERVMKNKIVREQKRHG